MQISAHMKKQLQITFGLVAMFSVLLTKAQVCLPTYSVYCSSSDYIDNFSTTGGFTNITNLGSGCNGTAPNNYVDNSSTMIVSSSPGNSFNFTVQSGSAFSQGFRIWIDYNNNSSFLDPGEDVWNSGFASTSAFTGTINVPLTASGFVKMRVRCQYAGVPADPCNAITFGDCEDYGALFCTIPSVPTATSPVNGCIGSTATLTASGTGTMAWYTQATGGTPVGTGSPFTTPVLSGNITYYVEAVNNGCVSPTRTIVNVIANPPPQPSFALNYTQCGDTVALDAGNPGSVYLWSTGFGGQILNVTQTGYYTVTIQDTFGCIGSGSSLVTINTPPSYTLGADTAQCGGSISLDAGSGFTSYTWSSGDTTQNSSISTTGNVYVTVTDSQGCVLSDTVAVAINAAPAVVLGADTTQCGGSVTIDAGNPGMYYFWSDNTTNQTTQATTSGTYSVDVVSIDGCHGYDTILVTIDPVPQVSLGPDTVVCTSSYALNAGNPGSTYLWNTNQTSQNITASSNGQYDVIVTNPQGCVGYDTVNVTLSVNPTISAGADQTICIGSNAVLNGTGGNSYIWSTGATTPSISVSPTVTTTYYVIGTNVSGCDATDVVTVYVMPLPTASFTYTTVGVTVTFNNTSTNGSTYSWNFGDSQTSTQQSPIHTYTANGTYTVTLTVTGPCGVQTFTQTVVISGVGIADESLGLNMNLYPNPNDGQFTLNMELATEQDVKITILDVRGAIVYSEQLNNTKSYNNQISLQGVESGMYFIQLQTETGVAIRKFLIQ